ncbi:MAG: cation:proton antiporter, partial [Nitrosopumilaceae archaeon]
FIGGTVVLGCFGMPKIFSALANFERYEFTILVALGLAFGLSFLSYSLGFSAATGAFLAGVILAGSRFSGDITTLITPTREIFVAIFFVTIGALMDVNIIAQYWIPVVVITIVTIIGKIIATYAGVRLFRLGHFNALGIGFSMAQLGEFSFIVLKVGQDLGATSAFLFPIVGMVVVLTTIFAPIL